MQPQRFWNIENTHTMVKSLRTHWGPCRWKSEVVFYICKWLHLCGDYKINIIHFVRGDEVRPRGHAWVTRNGKELPITPAYRPEKMILIGENDKYRYWASEKEGARLVIR